MMFNKLSLVALATAAALAACDGSGPEAQLAPATQLGQVASLGLCELIEVDQHTWAVLQLADRASLASGGSFNVACAPWMVEWGYLPALAAAVPACVPGLDDYDLEEGCVRKTAAAWIDLGGIAKGYAVDLAIAALQQHGVVSARVNAGGDLRVDDGADWPIAIRAPQGPTSIGAHLLLRDAALATSAKYFSGGGDAGSLVDGRDGQARTALYRVTVRAPSCALADALTGAKAGGPRTSQRECIRGD